MIKPTICVLIMMKDESHCILETLTSTSEYASEYIICDTGSTDNSIDICNNFFKKTNIKGQIFHHEWQNFGYNYSILYKLGKAHSKADYLWQIDADDIIVGKMNVDNLTKDAYFVTFGNAFTYKRIQILKNTIAWKHKGRIHGYVCPVDELLYYSGGILEGDYYIDSRRKGNRHKNIDPRTRYAQDALLLEEDVRDYPNEPRWRFYLAQCYFDSEQYVKSLENYKIRIEMGGWGEEVYFSRFRIAQIYEKLHKPIKETVNKYLECYKYHKHRAEPLYFVGVLYNRNGNHVMAKKYLSIASNIPCPTTEQSLFVSKDMYEWKINDELAGAYYGLGEFQNSYNILNKLVKLQLDDNIKKDLNKKLKICLDELMKKWISEADNETIEYSVESNVDLNKNLDPICK